MQTTAQKPKEGITGYIYEESGNRMPMIGATPEPPRGLSTTLYIYQLTNLAQVRREGQAPFYTSISTRAVARVRSDSTGAFSIRLAPGRYSLFVKAGGRFFASTYDGENNIAPVTVYKDSLSIVRFVVNPTAVY
ncbi:MAG: carboxypeptidase regulatory-like domain-containing protein [Bacteroidetes bacterium]|nr:carboxypeptidase regulatory-like domain-containing protein [Bacteroidota bacterium]